MTLTKLLRKLDLIYCQNCGVTAQIKTKKKISKAKNCCAKPFYVYFKKKADFLALAKFINVKYEYTVGFRYGSEKKYNVVYRGLSKKIALLKHKYICGILKNEEEYIEKKNGEIIKKIIHYHALFRQEEIK